MLGAVIFAPKFRNEEDEAYIGFGGPLVGGLAAAVLFAIWWGFFRENSLLLVLGLTATWLNLFNLIPIRPLDGGRVTQIVGGWFMWVGAVALLGLTILIHEPVMLMLWIMILPDIKMSDRMRLGIGLGCQLAMIILMLTGFSSQPFWIDVIDIGFASFLNLVIFSVWWRSNRFPEEKKIPSDLPPVIYHLRTRVKWLGYYLGLTGVLIGLMITQIHYLPPPP